MLKLQCGYTGRVQVFLIFGLKLKKKNAAYSQTCLQWISTPHKGSFLPLVSFLALARDSLVRAFAAVRSPFQQESSVHIHRA